MNATGMRNRGEPAAILTIGHSTRTLEDFVLLLQEHGVRLLVDVRSVPRSRANPQFNLTTLPARLAANGIDHWHAADLGGLRRPRPDSPNGGWRNESFRGYADHMQTPELAAALAELVERARARPAAIMCAEAVYWRCHRSLIADALLVRGLAVAHIMGPGRVVEARLHQFAHVEGTRITYPAPPGPPGISPPAAP